MNISKRDQTETSASCLNCGHAFTASETAAMAALKDDANLSVIDCASCGSHNIVRAEPQGGFDNQPTLAVLRIAGQRPETADVFDETVEAGTDVHPITRGGSA